MPDLDFLVEAAVAVARAAVPMMSFRIRVTNRGIEAVHVAALQCKIEIDTQGRPYRATDRERLTELFGESSRWGEATGALLWTSATLLVPAFSGDVECELRVPCSFDFNVAATKYFYGLQEGIAPLRFEFSGTAVLEDASGVLRSVAIAPREVCFSLPIHTWSEMMDLYYPNSMWLRLPRETFERLYQYKVEHAIPTWEDVFERMLPVDQEVVN